VKRVHWIALAILVAASIVAGFLGHHEPGHGHWWDAIPGFYALYGFAGSALLIFLSRMAGRKFLEREEDYYESSDEVVHEEEEEEEEV